jgi:FtsP/CotA-like multicopper oxidase with cupredoxin domain
LIDRRDLLRLGVSSSFALLSRRGLRRRIPSSWWDDPTSPPTTPFVQPLPVPPVARWLPRPDRRSRVYRIVAERAFLRVHPEMPGPTEFWRFRDLLAPGRPAMAMGPTLQLLMKRGVSVNFQNDLLGPHVGFGLPDLTIHYHGGHMPADSDGFPEHLPEEGFKPTFGPGESRDYLYPMDDRRLFEGEQNPERAATQWYHDHRIHFTGANVYRGLVGFVLVFDELDAGDETGRLNPLQNLRLPSGAFDIPLALLDRLFAPNGTLVYLPGDSDGFLGDRFLVNGAIQPFLGVQRRKYRFRLLNGCNARIGAFALTDGRGQRFPFDWIGNAGGLFSAPLREREIVLLSPAQRADIVVDFSPFHDGTRLYLENLLPQDDGRGPGGTFLEPDLESRGDRWLEFRVQGLFPAPDPSRVPDVLRPTDRVPESEIASARRSHFVFERKNGAWAINDRFDDMTRPVATYALGTPQVWRLENKSGGWWHPIHVHQDFMRVLTRNGRMPPADERDGIARTDTVLLGPNDRVDVFLRFRNYSGRWVFHCHNLEHEDHFMMARFDVV